jgi:Fe-S cluster assembly protein SufD
MTVAIAEKNSWWTDCFAAQAVPQDWLRALQLQEKKSFLQMGLPQRRDERWKYSDVTFLEKETYHTANAISDTQAYANTFTRLADSISLVFLDGHYSAILSDTRLLSKEIVLCSMQEALTSHPEQIKKYLASSVERTAFTSLNTALLTDGIYLNVPAHEIVTAAIHLIYLNSSQADIIHSPRHLIILNAHAKATILEEHHAQSGTNYFTNIVTDIDAGANAELVYYKIQNDSINATHISQINVQQKKDSTVSLFQLALGAHFAREDVLVDLLEAGAASNVNGFYFLNNDNQHIDHHIQIDHKATHGSSDMLYKGILDKKSHGVFNGKIIVHKDAQKTRSEQANHNLLLSKSAMIDTKPDLEIYANDVKCSHGSTVGQLDSDALFYLRARGIDQQTALKLLNYAFAEDAMNKITHPAIRAYMNTLLNGKLTDDNR